MHPDIVARAAAGDPAALPALLADVRTEALRHARARLGPASRRGATADDVAQEVCLAVLRALPTWQDRGVPFAAFVHRITRNAVVDVVRRATREVVPAPPPPDPGPEPVVLAAAATAAMRAVLDRLPERARAVVVLRVGLGLPVEEVAHRLGTTPGAVRVAQYRALTRLRAVLGNGSGPRTA